MEKLEPFTVEMQMGTTTLQEYLAVSTQVNIHPRNDPAIPLSGIYSREMGAYDQRQIGEYSQRLYSSELKFKNNPVYINKSMKIL